MDDSEFLNKTILITGGSGSIGTYLTESLLKKNCKSIRVFSKSEYDLYNFKFPYKLLNKSSKQCIALELLGREMFPPQLIQSAINIKNTISKHIK